MFRLQAFILLNFLWVFGYSQDKELYSKAYGHAKNPVVIFFHGGPGYNSVGFELSSAEDLANKGFYVIVFDQRGCGRSANYKGNGNYSFNEQANDIIVIYKKYDLKTATLIGHSWGGTLATKFAEKHPEMVSGLIFVDSPLSYQLTFKSVLQKCMDKYTALHDSVNLKRIAYISKLDTSSLAYSSMCFTYAMTNGFYSTMVKTESAKNFTEKVKDNPDTKYLSKMDSDPVNGVYKSEKYTTLNLTTDWQNLKNTIPLYGIYGDEDGLFDKIQLDQIKNIIGETKFYLLKNASHNPFIDKHEEFMSLITKIISTK